MSTSYQKPIVGKNLLQMLMLQLYSNPRCIYREYIQNSLDSIYEAVKIGVLNHTKDGLVSINIDKNDIRIEDNGTGIKSSLAPKVLMDIANSKKNGIDTAGRFGVGRLSGGGYCEKLEFVTSYAGESECTIVTMDIKRLREILDSKEDDVSAVQVMDEICEVNTVKSDKEKHFFKVCLHNIVNSADILLNEDDILSYIKQTAPIGYSTVFNTLIDNCPQKEFANRHKQVEKIRVCVNKHSDVEKSYGLKIEGSGDEIHKLRYFELPSHPKFGRLAWGWYAVTRFTKQIDDSNDENVGIRLRIHNISLDKNILNPLFKEARGNKYFYGEIFITNDKIEPDSGRQGMAAGEEADALKSQIREYFKNILHQVYTKANKYKTLLDKIRGYVEKVNKTNVISAKKAIAHQMRVTYLKEFLKNIDEGSNIAEVNDVIAIYKQEYEEKLSEQVSNILLAYDPQTGSEAPQPTTKPTEGKTNEGKSEDNQDGGASAGEGNVEPETGKTSPSNPNPPIQPPIISSDPPQNPPRPPRPPKTPKKPKDPIEPLIKSGKYSEEQVSLLREVYKFMGYICNNSEKKKLANLIEWAVNNIVQGGDI